MARIFLPQEAESCSAAVSAAEFLTADYADISDGGIGVEPTALKIIRLISAIRGENNSVSALDRLAGTSII
jgi:hypothetical protein